MLRAAEQARFRDGGFTQADTGDAMPGPDALSVRHRLRGPPLLRDARAVVPPAGLARDPHRLRLLHPVDLLHDGPREGRRMLGTRDGARGRAVRRRVGVLDHWRVPALRVQEAVRQ